MSEVGSQESEVRSCEKEFTVRSDAVGLLHLSVPFAKCSLILRYLREMSEGQANSSLI